MAVNAIGIDLGTTYSCVGVFQHGNIEILMNDQSNRITPSCVAFTENKRLIGDPAKDQASTNPTNTVFEAKRLIGRRFGDECVQSDIKHWPFEVIDDGGKPKIEVVYKGENKIFDPREISSMILRKMKEIAEGFLGETVTNAVITVPAYFNDSQRQATKDAGTIAGLNVLRIINEPTAAAITYGVNKRIKNRNVLIFDLGGGTFDVSLLTIEDSKFKVISIAGDTHLGGVDFDNRMVDHFIQEFKHKHKIDISSDEKAKRRLKTACEKAKRILSSSTQANIQILNLVEGIDFSSTISRTKFEYLNADLFQSTIECVKKVLIDAYLEKGQVHDVVTVGGSTRIPKVQELLQKFFPEKKLKKNVIAEGEVAYGATVLAVSLNKNTPEYLKNIVVLDVTPLSLGLKVFHGKMHVLINRNTPIPTKHVIKFTTARDYEQQMLIELYEGERWLAKANNLLGEFTISGILPALRAVQQIYLFIEIDVNGIIHLSAIDKGTQNKNIINITRDKGKLSQQEIKNMIKDAEKYKNEDEKEKKRIDAKNSLEKYALYIESIIRFRSKSFEENRKKIEDLLDKVKETFVWMNKNPKAGKEQFDNWYNELKTVDAIIEDNCCIVPAHRLYTRRRHARSVTL